VSDDRDELGRLVGQALKDAGWDVDAAAERLMRLLGGGLTCLLALDHLADLAEEARLITDGADQVANLLRLRISYRPDEGEVV
jgi:hypothetical protein